MNFEWAIQKMKKGKKVRRDYWGNKETYISFIDNIKCEFNNGVNFLINKQLVDATDWEILKEKVEIKCNKNIELHDELICTSIKETDNRKIVRLESKEEVEKSNRITNFQSIFIDEDYSSVTCNNNIEDKEIKFTMKYNVSKSLSEALLDLKGMNLMGGD